MAKKLKNRILTKKELEKILLRLNVPLPDTQTQDSLFTTLLAEIKKPPPPPPPGLNKRDG